MNALERFVERIEKRLSKLPAVRKSPARRTWWSNDMRVGTTDQVAVAHAGLSARSEKCDACGRPMYYRDGSIGRPMMFCGSIDCEAWLVELPQ